MTVLQGSGTMSGTMPVLATAARIDDVSGRFTLSDSVLALAARRLRRGDGPLDTVLVASDASHALLLRLPPAFTLVGVVAEQSLAFVPPMEGIALVSGVDEALTAIQDSDWVIVDPARGRVVVNPQAEEIARLQNARHLRPSVLLGASHTPARTLGGRTIAVWARVNDNADVDAALEKGADGILIEEGSALLTARDDETEDIDDMIMTRLLAAADAMGAGEVCIAARMDFVHPRTIVTLAARCRLSWALPPDSLPFSVSEMYQELNALIDTEEDEGNAAFLPRLAAVVSQAPAVSGADDPSLLDFDEALWIAETLPDSAGFLPPIVRVILPRKTEGTTALDAALAMGVTGVIVATDEIQATKDNIRQAEN
jgi:phosphohistidine swiveling domain-containing protein